MKLQLVLAIAFSFLVFSPSCKPVAVSRESVKTDSLQTNQEETGPLLRLQFIPGKYHNHPLMAIWIEDLDGQYLQTIYVPNSIAHGVFRHGSTSTGKWTEGEVRRPAALPYWGHRWGVQATDGFFLPTPQTPLPDAVSGATPQAAFYLESKLAQNVPDKFRILFEINQPWDWNEYWTNSKYPGDVNYATSSQPALVYAATIDRSAGPAQAELKPIGHSHYSGQDGSLTSDLSTLTTALEIAQSIVVRIK